ncbi:MAG: TRAM domain-containing protein [Christensenellaceae bacterium]|nr:TRAM domain-containing protein [Christensenellaceae bacterium]
MQKVFRIVFTLSGLGAGLALAETLRRFLDESGFDHYFLPHYLLQLIWLGASALLAAIFTISFFLLSGPIVAWGKRFIAVSEEKLRKMPMADILFSCVGLLFGLITGYFIITLLNAALSLFLVMPLSLILCLGLAYLGARIFSKRWRELPGVVGLLSRATVKEDEGRAKLQGKGYAKVLDTSAIIDGRIFDVCATGFMEGPLVIPQVVLRELRHIADSADGLKRNRGRRGLDVLQRIQKDLSMEVIIDETEFEDTAEADLMILKLAQALPGFVVTNDYNLNKVAELTGIRVLNINDLANALKPVLIPGEEIELVVMKEGKEPGQGIAYLEDGTMIVIDNARKLIGETVAAVVTSVLQTSAGRMIFAKLKEMLK